MALSPLGTNGSYSNCCPEKVEIYDTTLRDGNQSVGVNFTATQKLKVTEVLIGAGVDCVEGGWPNETNPTDVKFFELARQFPPEISRRISAFGMTRRASTAPQHDRVLQFLIDAGTTTVTIFGKSWKFQVEQVLRTTLEENLKMIGESIQFLRSANRVVVYDAEHFFDGFRSDADYAMSTLRTAKDNGASVLVLCDTRGGAHPTEIYDTTKQVLKEVGGPVGIHCHNDRGMATANSLFAVMAGASHVQGTINGLGERVGNADLVEVVANLHLMGAEANLKPIELASLSRLICELSGHREDPFRPFVGKYAFAHKGGVHGDAVRKTQASYEFFDPSQFGNNRHITVSSQAGGSNLLHAAEKFGFHLSKSDGSVSELLREVKRLEAQGCNLEFADATVELLFQRTLTTKPDPFRVVSWTTTVRSEGGKLVSDCQLAVEVKGKVLETSAAGNGPVNALDQALRVVLTEKFGSAFSAVLVGYRVREIEADSGTAARVAVYVDFSDGTRTWTTVASSTNVLEASAKALIDGYVYSLRTKTQTRRRSAS